MPASSSGETPPPDTSLLDYAIHAHTLGLCVIPPQQDGTKRPFGTWKRYQTRLPTEDEVRAWWSSDRTGFGIICGQVSGGLEMFEFEGRAVQEGIWDQFLAACNAAGLEEVLGRVVYGYFEQTPSGGFHILWRCTEVEPNLKLARRPATPEELATSKDKLRPLIETRGEGGFTVLAPSNGTVHPDGKTWTLLEGSLDTIATITPEERHAILDVARTFDRTFPDTPPPARVDDGFHDVPTGDRPGDEYEQAHSCDDVLEQHGFIHHHDTADGRHYTRPGKDTRHGSSATVWADNQRATLFSSAIDAPIEAIGERNLTAWQLHVFLAHQGDWKTAATEWRRDHPRPVVDVVTAVHEPPPNIDPDTGEIITPALSIELDEFLAEPEPEYVWLVPGLIEESDRVILTAGEGGGKSTLLRQMGVQMASGLHPFTLEPIDPLRVTMVDLENGRRHIRRKLRALREAADGYEPPNFRIESRPEGIDLTRGQDISWLAERCRVNEAQLLIIGPIYKMSSGDPTREEVARPVALALDEIRSEMSMAVLIEAHTPYADGSKAKRPERPYGASLWSRWPEFGIFLAPEGDLRHWRGQRDERAWPKKLRRDTPWPWAVEEAEFDEEEWHGPTNCMTAVLAFLAETPGVEFSGTQLYQQLHATGANYRKQTVFDSAAILARSRQINLRVGPRSSYLYSHVDNSQGSLDEPS